MNPTIKSGYKTTEFWVTVLTALVGLAVATGYIDPTQAHGAGVAAAIQLVAGVLAMAIPAATYAISRGLAKAPAPVTVLPTAPAAPAPAPAPPVGPGG